MSCTIAVAIDPTGPFVYFVTGPYGAGECNCRDCLPYIGRVDIGTGNIMNKNMKNVISSGIGKSEGLALDYENQLLYWTDAGLGHIEMASLNCKCDAPSCTNENVCRKIIVTFDNDDKTDRPRSIVVSNGWIYWSDWGDKEQIFYSF